MKKTFGFISALVAVVLSLGFASCSSSNEAVYIVKEYTCAFSVDAKGSTSAGEDRVTPWFNEKVAELNKTKGGKYTFKHEEEYENLQKQCANAVENLVKEFNNATQTHDFGQYKVNDLAVLYTIKEKDVVCDSKGLQVEYNHMDVTRMQSDKTFTVKVTENLNTASTYEQQIAVSFDDLGFTPEADPVIDYTVKQKIYNCKTFDMFPGGSFASKITIDNSNRQIIYTLSYDKKYVSDYLGKWYILVPTTIGEMKFETEVYIENI